MPDPELSPIVDAKGIPQTALAGERTFLAWWRTGIAAVVAAIAVGKLLPVLTDRGEALSVVVGMGFALVGAAAIGYGWHRHRSIDEALTRGEFSASDPRVTLAFSVAGFVLAIMAMILVIVSA